MSMRIRLEEDLANCRTLDEVQTQTQETLRDFQDMGDEVVYIAGPISADGEEHIQRNIDELIQSRGRLVRELGYRSGIWSFTAPFIFTPEVYEHLGIFKMEREVREAKLQEFWDGLILSGVVNGIYFVQGWERSAGARRERETAEMAGIPTYDLPSNP
jgi:hypothetical protein